MNYNSNDVLNHRSSSSNTSHSNTTSSKDAVVATAYAAVDDLLVNLLGADNKMKLDDFIHELTTTNNNNNAYYCYNSSSNSSSSGRSRCISYDSESTTTNKAGDVDDDDDDDSSLVMRTSMSTFSYEHSLSSETSLIEPIEPVSIRSFTRWENEDNKMLVDVADTTEVMTTLYEKLQNASSSCFIEPSKLECSAVVSNGTSIVEAEEAEETQASHPAQQPEHESSSQLDKKTENNDMPSLLLKEQLGPSDILSGRGRLAWNNLGNRRFRKIINENVQQYENAKYARDKTRIVKSIVTHLSNVGGRFIKTNTNTNTKIEVLNSRQTHEKVGHAFRDLIKMKRKVKKNIKNSKIKNSNGNDNDDKSKQQGKELQEQPQSQEEPKEVMSHANVEEIKTQTRKQDEGDDEFVFGKSFVPL